MCTAPTIESRIAALEAGPRVVPANAERFDPQAHQRMTELVNALEGRSDDQLRSDEASARAASVTARAEFDAAARRMAEADHAAATARAAVNARFRHRTEWAALAAKHPAMVSGACEIVEDRWVPRR